MIFNFPFLENVSDDLVKHFLFNLITFKTYALKCTAQISAPPTPRPGARRRIAIYFGHTTRLIVKCSTCKFDTVK